MCVWNKCEWVQIRKLFPYMALGALLLHSEWSCNWPESVTFLFHSVMGVTNVLHSIYNYYSKPPSWISFCFHFYHCHHNYLLKKIYWSIVDWQCWLSFRCATQWFSFTDIHSLFSHADYHRMLSRVPCAVGPCWCSVLYIAVCMCSLQALDLSPLPHLSSLVALSLFLISVSLFLFCK